MNGRITNIKPAQQETPMKIGFDRALLHLGTREVIRLYEPRGARVECVRGALWITQNRDYEDYFLAANDALTLDRPGLALIHAQAPSEIVISEPAPRPQQQQGRAKGAPAPDTTIAKTRPKGTGETKPRLKEHFIRTAAPALMKERGYTNVWQVPRLHKIVINMGVGEGRDNAKVLDFATADLQLIAGQKPVVTKAKKSIANFKLREGVPIGAKVTLRAARMYEFLDRLMNVALPRVRDFKGVSPKGFDGRGNYTLGLKDQLLFPEIDYMKVDKARGMNVSVVTTAKTDEEARKLLQFIGMPFRTS